MQKDCQSINFIDILKKFMKQNFMQFNNNFRSGASRDSYPIYSPTVYDPYRMTHNELRQVILKQTLRLEQLKKLYEKEQKILSQTYRDPIRYDNQGSSNNNASFGRNSFNNPGLFVDKSDTLNVSPIKILSNTTKKQHSMTEIQQIQSKKKDKYNLFLNQGSYSHRIQYDQPDSSLLNSSFNNMIEGKQFKKQKIESERLKYIEQLSKNVENRIEKKIEKKTSQKKDLGCISNKQHSQIVVSNQHDEQKSQRRIVYDSPQKSAQKQLKKTPSKYKETKPQQIDDSIIAQINIQSKTGIDHKSQSKINKTNSKKKLKNKSKSTLLIRPKSYSNFKPKFTQKPLTLGSKINQIIDHRLLMLSCVFKDSKWRNQKNQKEFLFNRFQMEEKGRKQIKSLVNNDNLVLKKHKMVVN